MNNFLYILTLIFILTSCKYSDNNDEAICLSCDEEEKIQKAVDELDKFDKIIVEYYEIIETNPNKVINETEILIKKLKTEPDTNNVKWNKLGSLYDLRTETFYKMGKYKLSIEEIYKEEKNNQEMFGGNFSFGDNACIHLACNYVKFKDFKKAKQYLDSASSGWYITDFILANYYEVIGDKALAIKNYNEILDKSDNKHYFYYKDAQKRVVELNKTNFILLSELYFPSDRPDNIICKTD